MTPSPGKTHVYFKDSTDTVPTDWPICNVESPETQLLSSLCVCICVSEEMKEEMISREVIEGDANNTPLPLHYLG